MSRGASRLTCRCSAPARPESCDGDCEYLCEQIRDARDVKIANQRLAEGNFISGDALAARPQEWERT